MATIAGKITTFQAGATTFRTDTITFQPTTIKFQPTTTIGSGALQAAEDAVVLKMSKNTQAKQVASGEKGKPLSLKLAHFAEKSRGGGTIVYDFKLRVGSVVFMPVRTAG